MTTSCTLEPVHWFSCALRSRSLGCDEEQAAGAPGSPLLWRSSGTVPGPRGVVLHEVACEESLPCSDTARLTQQIANASVVPCRMCAVTLFSHFIVSIVSGAPM